MTPGEVVPIRRPRVKRRKPLPLGEAVPFAPLLRNSEVASFNRCPQAWEWSYVDGMRMKVDAPALRFGTLVHKALELRYPPGLKRGPHPAATFRELYEEEMKSAAAFGFRDEDGKWADAGTMGEAILSNYVDTYGNDSRYRVLASEMAFSQPVYDPNDYPSNGKIPVSLPPYPGARPMFYYTGVIDGLWYDRQDKAIVVQDYKTTAAIRTDHLPIDPQAGGYWTFGQDWIRAQGLLKPGQDILGMLYTFIRKAAPDERPRNAAGQHLNKNGSISERQPAPYFGRFLDVKSEVQREKIRARVIDRWHVMQDVRSGRAPVTKSPGAMTCNFCSERPMCILHEVGADWESYRSAVKVPWDPYSQHAIQDEET